MGGAFLAGAWADRLILKQNVAGGGFLAGTSAKYKTAEYNELVVYIYIYCLSLSIYIYT